MNIIEYAGRDMLAIDVANAIAGDLETHLLHHDIATLAVAGGTTPGPIFDILCAADLDWSRVRVMPTDERWVPGDNPRSNEKLIRDRLLTARAATATYLPLYANADQPEDVLAELESTSHLACRFRLWCLEWGKTCTPRRCSHSPPGSTPPCLPTRRFWRRCGQVHSPKPASH